MSHDGKFPEGFLWGAATSAYQVEGGSKNDWTDFKDAGAACSHYDRFEEDFDIAKQLGHNAHRFSIEWSRVEPEEGKFDEKEIEHYQQAISALRERGMEPFITLWHWTLPLWVQNQGGWAHKKTIQDFTRYCYKIARSLEQVTCWITINEPLIYAGHAYMIGVWPPQQKNIFSYYHVLLNLASAHRTAYDAIKKIHPQAKIGIAKNNIYFDGGFLKHAARWWWNHWFLNKIQNHQDFIGLNYYFHNRIKGFRFNQNENKEVSDMGWEIYPEGLYHVLMDLKRFRKPIYITENGVADAKDEKRAAFIRNHLNYALQAIKGGVDVRGYFHWSLLDNFEWDKGFWPRFGLVEMNYETMERKIRPSAWEYKKIIQGG